jgi:plasmid stabilization system protein ParE
MKVRFLPGAIADLQAIIRWYDEIAPASTHRIVADIERSIERLKDFPHSGPATGQRDIRRIVTLRYHFKIAYRIEPERIVVIGVFRHQNRIS